MTTRPRPTGSGEPQHVPELTGPLVLVIDDEPDIRWFLASFLTDEGYRVIEAENGEDGLEVALRLRPDVILLDLLMPRMNGAEFLDRYRLSPAPRAPVIMASASSKYLGVPLPVGADAYADKPFDIDRLLDLLANLAPGAPRQNAV